MGNCSCSCSDKNEFNNFETYSYSGVIDNNAQHNVSASEITDDPISNKRCQETSQSQCSEILQSYARTYLALKYRRLNRLSSFKNKQINKNKPNLQITIEDENGFGRGQPCSKTHEQYINEHVKQV